MPRKTVPQTGTFPIAPPSPESRTRITIEIPTSLAEHYELRAIERDRTLEEEIEERLSRCKDHIAIAPLYLNDDHRRALEHAVGHNFSHPDQLVAMLKNAVTLKVGEVNIELEPRLQQRLKARVFRGESYEGNLKREVVKGLRRFTGMDPQ